MFSLRPLTPGRSEQIDRADDVDLGAGRRGVVERFDHVLVGECVDLDPDSRRLARLRGLRDRADRLDSLVRSVNGATSILRKRCGRPKPVM